VYDAFALQQERVMVGKHWHWYPRDVDAYARDTAHLSLIEHGAYTLLLDQYYRSNGKLPADAMQLHRLCRCITDAERLAVDQVMAEFFSKGNARADLEMKKASAISKERADAARCRWNAIAHAKAMLDTDIVKKKEGKKEKKAAASRRTSIPDDFKISPAVVTWAKKHGHTDGPAHLQYFIDTCKAKGYQYVDWDAAFRNAITKNWAGVSPKQSL
jgi:uncharacterized protein YdaU (DUF1376 family)